MVHYGKHDVSTKPEVHSILWSEKDRTTATGNTYRKIREVWTCGFCHMRAERQTDRLAHRNTSGAK